VVLETRADNEKAKQEVKANKASWKKDEKPKQLSFNEQKEYKALERDIKKLETKKEEVQNKFTEG
jgi:ATP-binding cassette subfamily F protein uup